MTSISYFAQENMSVSQDIANESLSDDMADRLDVIVNRLLKAVEFNASNNERCF